MNIREKINPRTGRNYYYKDLPESTARRNKERMFVNGKYVSNLHPLYKAGRYNSFNDAAFNGLENYSGTKEGYVYIISNPAWKGWFKLGMAIDPQDRCNSYQTSSPLRDYELAHSKFFKDRRKAESKLHNLAEELSKENNGEWFKISKANAIKLLNSIEDEVPSEVSSTTEALA